MAASVSQIPFTGSVNPQCINKFIVEKCKPTIDLVVQSLSINAFCTAPSVFNEHLKLAETTKENIRNATSAYFRDKVSNIAVNTFTKIFNKIIRKDFSPSEVQELEAYILKGRNENTDCASYKKLENLWNLKFDSELLIIATTLERRNFLPNELADFVIAETVPDNFIIYFIKQDCKVLINTYVKVWLDITIPVIEEKFNKKISEEGKQEISKSVFYVFEEQFFNLCRKQYKESFKDRVLQIFKREDLRAIEIFIENPNTVEAPRAYENFYALWLTTFDVKDTASLFVKEMEDVELVKKASNIIFSYFGG